MVLFVNSRELTRKEKFMRAASDLYKMALRSDMAKHKGFIQPVISKGEITNNDYGVDFLFVGEAPGHDENKAGKPFVGRAGKVLHKWIEVIKDMGKTYMVMNSIPVIPLVPGPKIAGKRNNGFKIRPPKKSEIDFFKPYSQELLISINPRYIICVGKSAAKFLEVEDEFELCSWVAGCVGCIYHPAYYIRNGKDGLDDFIELIKAGDIEDNQKTKKETGDMNGR